MKRILAIWLPNWPVQRLALGRPERTAEPIVLYEKHPRRGHLVKACSAAAAASGVRPGMPLAEACALVHRPAPASAREPIHLAEHDPCADRQALVKLAEWCEQFSPIIGLAPGDEPDGLLLEAGGVVRLFGGEPRLAQTVAEAFRKQSLEARVAIADTPSAAWAVARFGTGLPSPERRAPVRIVPPGELEALDELPVAALRLDAERVDQLHRLGIRQIGPLRKLPRAGLAARFGQDLLRRLDQLLGTAPEAIVAHRPAPQWCVDWDFEYPTTSPDAIERVVAELLQRLAQRLVKQGRGVLRLECRLVCQGGRSAAAEVGLYQPAADWRHLLELVKVRLERLRLPGAIERVQVAAAATAPRRKRQRGLFAGGVREEPAELGTWIERLASRLGRQRVLGARLEADATIERAYRYVPLTGERPAPAAGRRGPSCRPLRPMRRPLIVFDPPQPIPVVAVAGGGPPAMFFYQRKRYRVARFLGPERIETGWWRGPSLRRDYYHVETEAGNRMWLFQNLADGKWFVQGEEM